MLAVVLAINALALAPELRVGHMESNDNALHLPLAVEMAQAAAQGLNPLDFWEPISSFGYPVVRVYQPLAHFLVTAIYFGAGKTFSVESVFVAARYLAIVLLPLSFFAAALLIEFPPLTAASAAVLAPLIATHGLYGLDYSSYVFTGRGLFSQSVAAHFLLLAIGLAYPAIRRGRHLALAGLFLGLTAASHFIYGYIGALTACLIALVPGGEAPLTGRILRTLRVGAMALVVSLFQLLPLFLDRAIIQHSRWEFAWKWDSFGARQVLAWLFTGELLDFGRIPVLTLLAGAGAGLVLWGWRRQGPVAANQAFVLTGTVLWILIFFGRPFWGPLLLLAGALPDLQLHRVITGVQIFAVLLAAGALAAIGRALANRSAAAALSIVAVILAPAVWERSQYLVQERDAIGHAGGAFSAARADLDKVLQLAKQRGGRVFAGPAGSWGDSDLMKVGSAPLYTVFGMNRIPQTSTFFHAMALTSDIALGIDESKATNFRLFNVKTVVAPVSLAGKIPQFLVPRATAAGFLVLDAPGGGYFDVVDVRAAVPTDRTSFYDVNHRWLGSDWPEYAQYLCLDFDGRCPPALPRIGTSDVVARSDTPPVAGTVIAERREGEVYRAELEALRPSWVLFKTTWHPNWKVRIDDEAVPTVMLSPGFIGVSIPAGRHRVVCRYEPGWWKVTLALCGLLIAAAAIVVERLAGRRGSVTPA